MAPVNNNLQPQSLSKHQAQHYNVSRQNFKNCLPVFHDTLNTKIIVLNFNNPNFRNVRNKNLL